MSLDMACLTVTDTSSNFVEIPVPSHARMGRAGGAEEGSFAAVGQNRFRLSSSFPRLDPVPAPLQLPRSPPFPAAAPLSSVPPSSQDPRREAYVRALAVAKVGAFASVEAARASSQEGSANINNNKVPLRHRSSLS